MPKRKADLQEARKLQAAALRLDARIEEVMGEAESLRTQGKRISGHGQFADKIRQLELDLDRLSRVAGSAAHFLELEIMKGATGAGRSDSDR